MDNHRLKQLMILSSIIAIMIVPFWLYLVVPRLYKISESHKYYLNYSGSVKTGAGEKNGQLVLLERKINFSEESKQKGAASVRKDDSISDFATREILAQSEELLEVDSYLNFPKDVLPKDYDNIAFSIHLGITSQELKFSGEEEIFGLAVFSFKYDLEGLSLPQEKLTLARPDLKNEEITADFWGKIWVEPKSGVVIRHEDDWQYYLPTPEEERQLIETGQLTQQDEEIKRLIAVAKSRKAIAQIYEVWVPLYLLIFALAFGLGASLKRAR